MASAAVGATSTALVAVDSAAAGSSTAVVSAPAARPGAQQYLIRGVSVEFPYPAYECQQVYMEKVRLTLTHAHSHEIADQRAVAGCTSIDCARHR